MGNKLYHNIFALVDVSTDGNCIQYY